MPYRCLQRAGFEAVRCLTIPHVEVERGLEDALQRGLRECDDDRDHAMPTRPATILLTKFERSSIIRSTKSTVVDPFY